MLRELPSSDLPRIEEETPESDIGMLVELKAPGQRLPLYVDVVSDQGLRDRIRERVLREAVAL